MAAGDWTATRGGQTATFAWLVSSPAARTPDWKPSVQRTIVPRLGTDQHTYHRLGSDWSIGGQARAADATSYQRLVGWLGYEVVISDGTDSWTTTLDAVDMGPLVGGIGGYEGSLTFVGRR